MALEESRLHGLCILLGGVVLWSKSCPLPIPYTPDPKPLILVP